MTGKWLWLVAFSLLSLVSCNSEKEKPSAFHLDQIQDTPSDIEVRVPRRNRDIKPAVAQKPIPKPREGYYGVYLLDTDTWQIMPNSGVVIRSFNGHACQVVRYADHNGVVWIDTSQFPVRAFCHFTAYGGDNVPVFWDAEIMPGEIKEIGMWGHN